MADPGTPVNMHVNYGSLLNVSVGPKGLKLGRNDTV